MRFTNYKKVLKKANKRFNENLIREAQEKELKKMRDKHANDQT